MPLDMPTATPATDAAVLALGMLTRLLEAAPADEATAKPDSVAAAGPATALGWLTRRELGVHQLELICDGAGSAPDQPSPCPPLRTGSSSSMMAPAVQPSPCPPPHTSSSSLVMAPTATIDCAAAHMLELVSDGAVSAPDQPSPCPPPRTCPSSLVMAPAALPSPPSSPPLCTGSSSSMMAPAARPTSHHLVRRRAPAKILCMQVGVIKRVAGTVFFDDLCIKFGQLGAHAAPHQPIKLEQ